MIERQLRMMALARDSIDRNVPQAELGKVLGNSNAFVIRKTMDQARRHSRQDITFRFDRLLEADLAIKRGVLEPEVALELLVAGNAAKRS